MNPFEMTVLIVAIVSVASIFKAKYGVHRRSRDGAAAVLPDRDAIRAREEIRALKERIAVLERIATDNNSVLDRQIEELRSRD